MVDRKQPDKIDLGSLFDELQSQMMGNLTQSKKISHHPPTKGKITETNWFNVFDTYLPKRYKVEKNIFVIDVNGQISQEIDLVIFDRQYSPFLFNKDGLLYAPSESIYAVFEVKPILNKETIEYAGEKALSVRRLRRTSAPIYNIYGKAKPKKPHPILSGILTLECGWKSPFGKTFTTAVTNLPEKARLDIGCVLQCGAFYLQYKNDSASIEASSKEKALIHFFLKLLGRMQMFGTVPALDFSEYIKKIEK